MSSGYCRYGSGYSDFVKVFSDEELEELLFGYPYSPSTNMGLWSWANNSYLAPLSPPALATLSRSSFPSPSSERFPKAAMAFYAFIEGSYDPRLFVLDPLDYFLGNETCTSPYVKALKTSPVSPKQNHCYFLRPCDSTGRAITSCRLF
ncbi:hypothetical protein O181_093444 [Austropuccinia psidii MF-1]|uniref:Uncharacterized protein n=1 Tax=Austropuccinia psidii MF-1 TaxID=1389203 RepID=A0A9Q3P9U3_9BASI|nr:hypothetical protein [Austropuccinia psidii MF-1]